MLLACKFITVFFNDISAADPPAQDPVSKGKGASKAKGKGKGKVPAPARRRRTVQADEEFEESQALLRRQQENMRVS